MRKIPTIFERDWNGDRSRVLNQPVAECQWVFDGEGAATRKYDGTCAMFRQGLLFRRHEVKFGKSTPEGFEPIEADQETGNVVGWVPVGSDPADRWFVEAFENTQPRAGGTYELLGPKVNGNDEGYDQHILLGHHDAELLDDVTRTYEGLASFFASHDIEGIVFHHEDGRMAKIKARDFGIRGRGENRVIPAVTAG